MAAPAKGAPPRTATRARPAFDELGVSGVRLASGVVWTDTLPELQGVRGRRILREMRDSDPTVSACVGASLRLCRRAEWSVEPKDASDAAKQAAEFAEGVLFEDMDHPFADLVGDALGMVTYGWSALETVWKRRLGRGQPDPAKRSAFSDGRIGLRKVVGRAQATLERWEVDPAGAVTALLQRDPNVGTLIPIPAEKLLLFRTTSEGGSPEGVSLLRAAYKPWWRKVQLERIEAVGIERDLAGMPVMYVPNALLTDPAQAGALAGYQKIVRDVKFNEQGGVLLPSDTYLDPADNKLTGIAKVRLELLKASGSGKSVDQDAVISRYDVAIARSFLAQFLMLGQGRSSKGGSRSLSEDHSDLFTAGLEWLLDQVADVLNRQLMPRLWALNGLDGDLMPIVEHSDVSEPDISKLGAYIQALANAGDPVAADLKTSNFLRRTGGLPELDPDDPRTDLLLQTPDEIAQAANVRAEQRAGATVQGEETAGVVKPAPGARPTVQAGAAGGQPKPQAAATKPAAKPKARKPATGA